MYLVGALWIGVGDLRRVLRIAALPLVATGATLLLVMRHRGTLADEQTICRSLGTAPAIVCSGSIAYLANGTDVARADVVRNVHAYHYLFYYPLLALLACLPLAAMAYKLSRRPALRSRVRIALGTALVALLASLPLFYLAMDWGRWIYILLFLDRSQPGESAVVLHSADAPLRQPRWAPAALLLYATCWNIPHYGNYPKKGYLNVPLHLLKEEMDHRHGKHTASTLAPPHTEVAQR